MVQVNKDNNNPLRIAVLGSGKGSNCQSIIDAIADGSLPAKIVTIISDVEDAYIIERGRKHGIPSKFISAAPYKTKLDGEAEQGYLDELKRYDAEVIVLAGFMRIVKKRLLDAFPRRILNIHPALLPAFPGIDSWEQALDYGVKIAGCTVHYVDEGIDTGAIIVQRAVPVLEDDSSESLHARIQIEEHKAYPDAIRVLVNSLR